MCTKRITFLFFSLLWMLSLSGQGFYKTFPSNGGVIQDVVETSDGGYFAVGGIESSGKLLLSKLSSSGQTQFHQEYSLNGAVGIAVSKDEGNGFWVLTQNYADTNGLKNALLKIDEAGQVQMVKILGNLPYLPNGMRDIIKSTVDGQILVVGETRNTDWQHQVWWIRVAADGSIISNQQINSPARVHKVLELPTGNFVLLGEQDLLKVDVSGNVIWSKHLDNSFAHDMVLTDDDGIVLLGTEQPGSNSRVMKFDWTGNLLWSRSITAPQDLSVATTLATDAFGQIYIPFQPSFDPADTEIVLMELNEDGFIQGNIPISPKITSNKILVTSDNHLLMAGYFDFVPAMLKSDFQGNFLSNKIVGNVYRDSNGNCSIDPGETGFKEVIVKAFNAAGESYYKLTDANGDFQIRVSSGDFWVNANPVYGPASFYALCNQQQVSVTGISQVATANPIGIQVLQDCSLLDVEVSAGILRRCTNNTFTVNYCNIGNMNGTGVILKVTHAPELHYQSSSILPNAQNAEQLIFNLPDLLPGACGSIQIEFKIACDASTHIGDVLCVQAEILQNVNCFWQNPGEDGSKLVASGTCLGNIARFSIQNIGTAATAESLNYVILEDQIMLSPVPFTLDEGGEIIVNHELNPDVSCVALRILPNGSASLSKPIAVVENCNNPNGNLDLLLNLPNNESDPSISTHCDAIVGSFDPNDKRGFPLGLGEQHLIQQGDALEYMIRFQNTGNDTAFLVIIKDQLPSELDAATVRPIGASHPYAWDVSDQGLVTFSFPGIYLPDSTQNEAGSHGYVMFRVQQKPFLAAGTQIKNDAAIYFDFNDPVITNESLHTIEKLISSVVLVPIENEIRVSVTPNPFQSETLIQLNGELSDNAHHLDLSDALGQLVLSEDFTGNQYLLQAGNRMPGIYFFQIRSADKTIASGRLTIKQ